MFASRTTLRPADLAVRAAIVALALATGYIHYTLGGLLFTLNAAGYAVAAVAMIVPLALAVRFRWVIRIGLMGYAATAIVMWAIQGPYYSTAYIAKAIEVALIVTLAVDFARHDGNPVALVRARAGRVPEPRQPPRHRRRRRRLTPPHTATQGVADVKRLTLTLGLLTWPPCWPPVPARRRPPTGARSRPAVRPVTLSRSWPRT